ncbi:MAG: thioredoxin domain-containing protein [Phycisphaerae bacterium]
MTKIALSRPVAPILAALAAVACGTPICTGQDHSEQAQDMTAPTKHKHTNHLIDATSPYLLQHAHNPVDWYPWGPEALDKAAKENKPIFLSIGYAACHWCHVMEHESFENEAVADILNAHFVCIKVDREERPDLDEIYMHVTQQMTGRGGWPMSVFMTPAKVPFYAGTYFPPEQFTDLLGQISQAWATQHEQIIASTEKIKAGVRRWAAGPKASDDLIDLKTVSQSAQMIARYFDPKLGGMGGGGNKFPPHMAMELMLREYNRSGDKNLLHLVELTLDQMARGGIYDHLGGGICRYSTDPAWLVPHFEKMLYDQALVSSIYLDAQQVTGNARYGQVAADIFDYVLADLQSPAGGFYSTRDADSEGLEGAFYIWTAEQIHDVLGDDDGLLFCEYYDVTPRGNWFESRGHAPAGPKNILRIKTPLDEFAQKKGFYPQDLAERFAAMRAKLLEVRAQRVPPLLDDKILTGWNGLMIASLAKGARVLDAPKYADAAAKAADFVLKNLRSDGRLLRTYRNDKAHLTGYLTDYAFLIEGLINLYEATFDTRWLDEAVALTDTLISHYYDPADGGFFFTADDAEELLARTKSSRDGAIPSGNSIQAHNLLRLALMLDRKDYRLKAESVIRALKPIAERSPGSCERLLSAVDFYYGRPKEIALVGDPADPATQALIRTVYQRYLPNKVVVGAAGGDSPATRSIPLLKAKTAIDGKPTAYVCENYRCKRPVNSPADLAAQLDAK